MEKSICKFCGKPIKNAPHFLGDESRQYSCGECSSFCMKQCPQSAKSGISWHKEPCVSCNHNPYKINHIWNGTEWVYDRQRMA